MTVLSLAAVSVTLANHPALASVELRVEEGERWLVLGPSGSGKSTLVRAAVGLVAPTAGRVELFGAPPRSLPRARRSQAQLLFQDPLATLHPELPVAASLAESAWWHGGHRGPAAERRVAEALRAVGLSDVGHRLPATLSGGERRRASLARVALARPRLLLADEPTTGLDEPLQAAIAELVTRAAPTCVVVTHDAAPFLPWVDRVLVLADGRVAETLRPGAAPATDVGRALLGAA